MNIKKYLPKKVIVVEVPMNQDATNTKATTALIKQAEIDKYKNVLVIESDIKYMRVRTKWF